MTTIRGTVQRGRVVLDDPASLPEGSRVRVEPIVDEALELREEDWQATPEAIAAWLRWYDSLEPLELTPQEEADWQAMRAGQREREKAIFNAQADRLREMWE